ncbi:MAG: hypothetical protein QM572_06195 [Nocardioides sp.]|uniref:hypothetical protein n=1 Tax=Nocardioides sp. TaxID=35761 RepID=UPI0039E5A395
MSDPRTPEKASTGAAPVRRPRHLMDPANPQRPVNDVRLVRVQRWVLSVLTVFTIAHLAIGIAIAAQFVDADASGARVGLCVIAMVFGVLGLAAGFAIHGRSPVAWPRAAWLLLGTLPGLVGLVFALR